MVDENKQFRIEADTSYGATEAVLKKEFIRKWLPVVYSLARFNCAERRYNVYEKEITKHRPGVQFLGTLIGRSTVCGGRTHRSQEFVRNTKNKGNKDEILEMAQNVESCKLHVKSNSRYQIKISNCFSRPRNAVEWDSLEPKKVIGHEV
jgi:hypothetical protein